MKKFVLRALALAMVMVLLAVSGLAETIRLNDKGDDVLALQTALAQLGLYTGELDGIFGRGTLKAVKDFQKAQSLTVDGLAGTQTQARLTELTGVAFPEAPVTPDADLPEKADAIFAGDYRTMQFGTAGPRVKVMQRALMALGFNVSVDGHFGSLTHQAVMAFQTVVGLTADGKAGAKTLAKLEAYFDADGNCLSGPIAGNPPAEPEPDPDAPAYGAPDRTLRFGDEGLDVKYVMQRLYDLGYYNKKVDEKFGAGMFKAVKELQEKNGLTVDGLVGKKTLAVMFSDTVLDADDLIPAPEEPPLELPLKRGDKGDEVKEVQQRLLALGYKPGKADGIFGAKTQSAVKLFQSRNALKVDGKVGERTLDRLFSADAVPAEGAAPVIPDTDPVPSPDASSIPTVDPTLGDG